MGWIGKILFVVLWVLTGSICFAEEVSTIPLVSINAAVDKNTVALDDVVQYTITISGQGLNNAPPSTPRFSNLRVISKSQSSYYIYNGQVSTAYSHIYILQPEKEGVANIGVSSITIGRKTYQSEPISITVTKPSGEPKQQRQGRKAVNPFDIWDDSDNFFNESRPRSHFTEPVSDPVLAETTLSRQTCYVHQMVILTFTFYRRVNLIEAAYTLPSTTGFWSVELPSKKDEKYENVRGIRYLAQDIKTALFPTQAARELTIPPATIILRLDPISAPITLTTKPLKLKVLPLPDYGKYKNLTPAVGRFTMSTTIDKKVVERGKPFTLKVKVEGEGNINTIPEPLIRLDANFKKLAVNATDNIIKGFDSVSGSKTFEYVIMPVKEGSGNVGPVKLLYFDPSAGKYSELSSNRFKIKILPSNIPLPQEIEKGTALPEKPIIRIDRGIIIKILRVILMIIAFGIVGFLIMWVIKKYRKYLHSDPVKMRQRMARSKARNGLKKAKGLFKDGNLKESVARVYEAVVDYLGDKYNFASAGITQDQLKDILSQQGITPEVRQKIDKFMLECDLIRWTPSSLDKEKANEIIRIAEGLIMGGIGL